MSRILVTGGNGFLGQHLVARLSALGETVRVFAREDTGVHQDQAATVIRGDIRDADAVARAVEGFEKVVHLVSNFRKAGSDQSDAYAVNVEGTRNVAEACLRSGVERLVHCSTIGVHGNVQVIPANEESAFNPGDIYQETKLRGERLVWEYHRSKGLPATVVRPISMFGPSDRRMLKLFRMIKKRRFVMVGRGDVLFQPAYIDDVVEGFLLCLRHPGAIGEAFIIGGEEYVPLQELTRMIAKQLGVPAPWLKVPLAPVLLAATLCERICVPVGVEPPLHRRRISFFQNNRAFCIEKARTCLGYRPSVSLEEGIRRTIRWYETHGWL